LNGLLEEYQNNEKNKNSKIKDKITIVFRNLVLKQIMLIDFENPDPDHLDENL
jgi:hypothetical protein